ncbi:MAG: YraN family protein [Thermoanaerobaculum sp.]
MKAKARRGKAATGRHVRLARMGEGLALLFLRLKGLRLEARNWRCSLGELDLVMRDGEVLVFVEVKTRASRLTGLPEEAVTEGKKAQLARLAKAYLASSKGPPPPCRFDVVAVDWTGLLPRLRHYPGAFVMKT